MATSKITKKTIATYLLLNLIVLGAAIALSLVWSNESQKQVKTVPSATVQQKIFTETNVTLLKPWIVSIRKPMPLVLSVTDQQGKLIAQFEPLQGKLMHLIVASDDLQFFEYLHPTFKGNGKFEANATFPQAGRYTLFSEYKPVGQREKISVLKVQAVSITPTVPEVNLNQAKTFGQTKANLSFSEPILKARKEVTLKFNLQQVSNNQPASDPKPELVERGHLFILRQINSLSKADYSRVYAIKDTPPGQMNFTITFPEPGKYKLWGQFNHNGKIVIIDDWVTVS